MNFISLFSGAAFRTLASPWDTPFPLCVGYVCGRPAFSLIQWAYLLAAYQGLCDRSDWLGFRGWLASAKPVLVEEFELLVEPLSTLPFPSEAWSQPGTHQVPPNLLFHPVFDRRKAPAGVSYREVVHPSS